MSFLIFDIETRVDKALVNASLFRDQSLNDDEAYEQMREQLRSDSGGRSDFFPTPFHIPISIVIGCAGADYELRDLVILRADSSGEEDVVRRFWQQIESFDGSLVSFNGRGFDLPVLELRALQYGCPAPRYFNERNGLRSRFGRHYDLYDFLANHGATRIRGGLDVLARLAGLAGKGGTKGSDVQSLWQAGRMGEIHRYCAADVVQTYLLLLHVEHLRGRLTDERLQELKETTLQRQGDLVERALASA